MRRNAKVQINLESADELVIIEGIATELAKEDASAWAGLYNEKYSWDMPETNEDVWQVVPSRALAWICDSSGLDYGAGFSNSATEWVF
ncbi:MAG: hypothetical protein ACR2PZ_01975 [Pseudomonadales bacterium]